jgi:ribosomal protein S16
MILNMHLGKTKVMCNDHVNMRDISVDGKIIEEVGRYVPRKDGDEEW